MSDATARPWRWSYEEATGDLVIHGPPYPGKDDACDIVLVDGAYLCGDDAALIVNRVNAHDALVEALEWALHWAGMYPLPTYSQEQRDAFAQRLQEAETTLGEAKP